MAADAVLPRPLAKAIQYDAFGQASGPDVTDSQRLDDRVGVGNEAATETANFFFLHDPEIDQFLRHPLRRHLFLEGNGCATHHGKLINRYDAAAREESVNSTGIDGARLAQVTQEIAPVDLAVALAPQVEKGFTSGQEETEISLNGGARPRQALACRFRGDVQRFGQDGDQTPCPHGTRFGKCFFDGGH